MCVSRLLPMLKSLVHILSFFVVVQSLHVNKYYKPSNH